MILLNARILQWTILLSPVIKKEEEKKSCMIHSNIFNILPRFSGNYQSTISKYKWLFDKDEHRIVLGLVRQPITVVKDFFWRLSGGEKRRRFILGNFANLHTYRFCCIQAASLHIRWGHVTSHDLQAKLRKRAAEPNNSVDTWNCSEHF